MVYKPFTWYIFPIFGLVLFIVHGLGEKIANFKIDSISISLLFLSVVPLLGEYLEKFKFGSVEAQFRTLSFAGQVLTFLHVLATDRKLTFYHPRTNIGEFQIGTASCYLLERLLNENRKRTMRTIKKWLKEEEENLKWFAAEVIGFFKLKELAEDLFEQYSKLNPNSNWQDWQLNCLWAHSKLCNNYQELNKFLIETKSESNQNWILDVYPQMFKAKEPSPMREEVCNLLQSLLGRKNLSFSIKEKAKEIVEDFDKLLTSNSNG